MANSHQSFEEEIINDCIDQHQSAFKIIDIVLCIVVRLWFMLQGAFYIYFLVIFEKNLGYLALIVVLLIILTDGINVIFKRKGKEYTWYNFICD